MKVLGLTEAKHESPRTPKGGVFDNHLVENAGFLLMVMQDHFITGLGNVWEILVDCHELV